MDHEIRRSGLAGNYCAIILQLDGLPLADEIERKCRQFGQQYPQATARLIPQGRRFAWQNTAPAQLPFHYHSDALELDQAAVSALLDTILNASSPVAETAPLELHLIPGQVTSQLLLRWFHPVCDAKGAELVLHHLFQDTPSKQIETSSAITQLLQKWSLWKKIKMGFRARQNIQQLDQLSSALPHTETVKPEQVNTRILKFDQSDSAQIMQLARQHAGLSGTALYFIGCMMRALDHAGGLNKGEAFCVPYAMNLRKRKALFPIFGNQVSFLFAQASRATVQSRTALFAHLREQNKQAIKQGLDRAMLPLMQAGSWLSLDKYGNILRDAPDGSERSSFWFSYTGSMDPEPDTIANCKVSGVHQFSQVTAPPSLGLLVNNFQGQLVLSYNYVSNHLSSERIDLLLECMKNELLENDIEPA